MFGNVNGCARIRNWGDAEMHFSRTPQPRERRSPIVWDAYKRPLDNARKHHYRLEKGAGYYDVCLYGTTMARYYEPQGTERRVCYNYDSRNLSHQFMWSVLHIGRKLSFNTTDGRAVEVPVCSGDRRGVGDFGTDLMLVNGLVDLARSKHKAIGVQRISDEKSAWMKELRTQLKTLLDLAALRVEKVMQDAEGVSKIGVYRGYTWTRLDSTASPSDIMELYDKCVRDRYYPNAVPKPTAKDLAAKARAAVLREIATSYRGMNYKKTPLPMFPEHLPERFVEM